ncbi:MAG: Uncharacterised protein [Halieaceae bacterium]|nr:MAG: Uncharacterised protein [Halieaceae bacterium]
MICLFSDDIHYVVNRNPSEQLAVIIDHRRRNPVISLKSPRHLGRGCIGGDGLLVSDHHLPNRHGGVRYEHGPDCQQPYKSIAAVHHDETVGIGRELRMPAEIAQNHIQRQICADGDGVGAHQTARNVIRKAQHFLKALAVLLIHDRQHLTGHLVG